MRKLFNPDSLISVLAIGIPIALIRAFVFMVAVDLIHDTWIPQVPNIGYWHGLLLVHMLMLVFYRFDLSKFVPSK